jgi:natural product biosynthesis luciferase-like monooxygenase protein
MTPSPQLLLAAIGQRSRCLRLGTSVSILPLHHPLQIAEQMAMLDLMSGGRVDLGVGRGSEVYDYEVFGLQYAEAQSRTLEALEIILKAWSGEPFTHSGQHYQLPEVQVWPRPEQRPHPPVWLAATASPETFRLAGQRGYHLMLAPFLQPVAELREKVALYHQALRGAGHDPTTREVLAAYHVYVGEDRAAARAAAEVGVRSYVRASAEIHARTADRPIPTTFRREQRSSVQVLDLSIDQLLAERRVVAGTAAECVEVLASLREELGLTYVAANVCLTGLSPAEVRRSMERLATRVVPHFQTSVARPVG